MAARSGRAVTVDVEIRGNYSSIGRALSYRIVAWGVDGSPTPAEDPAKESHEWMWGLPLGPLVGPLKDGERVRVTARRLSRAEGSRPRTVRNPFRWQDRKRRKRRK